MRIIIILKQPEAHQLRIHKRAAISCGVKSVTKPTPELNSRNVWRLMAWADLSFERCIKRMRVLTSAEHVGLIVPFAHSEREYVAAHASIGPLLRVNPMFLENQGIVGGRSSRTCTSNWTFRAELDREKSRFFFIKSKSGIFMQTRSHK